jgi:hypothetical protein
MYSGFLRKLSKLRLKYIKSKALEGHEVFSGLVILPSLRGSGGKDGCADRVAKMVARIGWES